MKFAKLKHKKTNNWHYGIIIGDIFLTSYTLNWVINKTKKWKK